MLKRNGEKIGTSMCIYYKSVMYSYPVKKCQERNIHINQHFYLETLSFIIWTYGQSRILLGPTL